MYFIKFKTYHKNFLFLLFKNILKKKPIFYSKLTIFTLPIKKKNVKILKSPHVNKKSIEIFQRKCYMFLVNLKSFEKVLFLLKYLEKFNQDLNFSYIIKKSKKRKLIIFKT